MSITKPRAVFGPTLLLLFGCGDHIAVDFDDGKPMASLSDQEVEEACEAMKAHLRRVLDEERICGLQQWSHYRPDASTDRTADTCYLIEESCRNEPLQQEILENFETGHFGRYACNVLRGYASWDKCEAPVSTFFACQEDRINGVADTADHFECAPGNEPPQQDHPESCERLSESCGG